MYKPVIVLSLMLILTSCQDEDQIKSTTGHTSFSFSIPDEQTPGGRTAQDPAMLMLSVENEQGNAILKDKFLELLSFGAGYVTEDIDLPTGNYNLTKFLVLDADRNVIYAAPVEGAILAQRVVKALPIPFSIVENEITSVTPQVIRVGKDDLPSRFGYVDFGFEIIDTPAQTVDLPVTVQNDVDYDSAYIIFSNVSTVRKQKLISDPEPLTSSGIIKGISIGEWNVSVLFFSTNTPAQQSDLRKGSSIINLTPTSLTLFSSPTTLSISDSQHVTGDKLISFEDYFVFYFMSDDKMNATITLPADPKNPFFGIEILNPNWEYFYADRTFYYQAPGEPDSHYLQAAGALERYNTTQRGVDFADATAFKKVTDTVAGKTWNIADAVIIIQIDGEDHPLFFYEWNIEDHTTGRKKLNTMSTDKLINRKLSTQPG